MNWLGTSDSFDDGDEDDGERKRRQRGVCVSDRVRWRLRSDEGKKAHVLVGTVVAIMIPTAIDASDIWVRWDGQARPQVFSSHSAGQFEVI